MNNDINELKKSLNIENIDLYDINTNTNNVNDTIYCIYNNYKYYILIFITCLILLYYYFNIYNKQNNNKQNNELELINARLNIIDNNNNKIIDQFKLYQNIIEQQIKKQQNLEEIFNNNINKFKQSDEHKDKIIKNFQLKNKVQTQNDSNESDNILYDTEDKNIKKHNLTALEITELNKKYNK
jgi:hypothetical protein